MIINIFNFISESEGFKINTDIFETNVLNLAVVIGVLVYYGRSLFTARRLLNLYSINLQDDIIVLRLQILKLVNLFFFSEKNLNNELIKYKV